MQVKKALTLLFICHCTLAAEDLFVGSWRINVAASKLHYAPSWENATLLTESRGPNVYEFTFVQLGADGKMQTTRESRTFDGSERPSEHEPGTNTISVIINARKRRTTWRKSGKTIGVETTTVQADGKRLISKFKGIDLRGHEIKEVRIYERT